MRKLNKKGILGSLGNMFQQLAFVGILVGIFLVVLVSLNSGINKDSFTAINESITIAGFAGTPQNATFTLTYKEISVVNIANSSNYIGVLNTDYNFTNGASADAGTIQLWNVTGGMFSGIAGESPTYVNITYIYRINSQANNALLNTTSGIANITGQFPLFGTILGLLLIVGIVFLLVRGKGNKDNML